MPTFDLRNTPPAETIRLMAQFLEHATSHNDQLPRRRILTRFHARTIPSIDIHGYLTRILKYAPCGSECFLAVIIYFRRMAGSDTLFASPTTPTSATPTGTPDAQLDAPASAAQHLHHQHTPSSGSAADLANGELAPNGRHPIVINSYNVHRLLIAGCMVAVKFLSDVFYTNSHIAKVGGLPVQELNRLEIEFLLFNDFNLNVNVTELQECGDHLLRFVEERQNAAQVEGAAPQYAAQSDAAKQYPVLTDSDFPQLKNDLILRAARGETVERVPVWIMRQAGRYLPEFREVRKKHDFFSICRTPELACTVTLQPIDRYAGLLDASIIFSDILVVPQALGLEVQMLESKGPHFPEPLVDPSHMSRLAKTVDVDKELGYVFEAITLTRTKLDGRVPLFGFTGAPWTLMAYMIEGGGSKTLSKAKAWLFMYPKESHELLQRTTDVIVEYLVGQAKAGAQLLQVFDSWAGELPPALFDEFAMPYLKQIYTRTKKALSELSPPLDMPMVVFARGAHYALEELASSGYEVIQIDPSLSAESARKRAGANVTLQGNADPCLIYGSKETIYANVETMLAGFGTESHYIANLGHGIYPDHSPEHLKWYLEAIRDVSTKNNAKKRQPSSSPVQEPASKPSAAKKKKRKGSKSK
ncbi:Uroporphyrinogen decarboxylase in heme biosynthesis [Polyrhizophydium stewartii]|uniref:Uroporphyrinogen decarboxylase n=1 Tax=Polyrhizophydium stewartii TaxID=2732419 RepID=A0ABR4NJZ9_9FUNG|nr:hypothetical protein HK105_003943 [Polyrhizophydium stewartii]